MVVFTMNDAELFLCSLPVNTFRAIYDECDRRAFSGCVYNGVYYGEAEIYYASISRDEGYEII